MKYRNWEERGMVTRLTEIIDGIAGNAVCWDPKANAKAGEPTMKDVSWNPEMQAGLAFMEQMTAEDLPKPPEPEEKVRRSAEYEITFHGMTADEAQELGKRVQAAIERETGLVKQLPPIMKVVTRADGNGVTLVEEVK